MSSRSPSDSGSGYIWSLTLRDALLLVLIADLAMLGKAMVRIPIHVPGHSGIVWVALFVVGRGLVDKRGAGVLMGIIAGAVATVFGFGDIGPLEWTKYVAAGALLDLVCWATPGTLEHFGKAAVAGAAAHLGKLATMLLAAIVLRLPLGFAVAGLGFAATAHVVFGVLGGVIGALILRELRRVPWLAPDSRGAARGVQSEPEAHPAAREDAVGAVGWPGEPAR
jgi:hypothetical protein